MKKENETSGDHPRLAKASCFKKEKKRDTVNQEGPEKPNYDGKRDHEGKSSEGKRGGSNLLFYCESQSSHRKKGGGKSKPTKRGNGPGGRKNRK